MRFELSRRWPRPDFLAKQGERARAAPGFAASGVLALVVAASVSWHTQAEFERLSARAVVPGPRLAASDRAPLAGSKPAAGDGEALRLAWRVSAALRHPWGEIFSTVERATPAGVQWLSFDHVAATGELRLEGQSSDIGGPLRLVDRLAAQPGWRNVALTSWQRPDAGSSAAAPVLRFAVQASLGAAALPDSDATRTP